MRLGSGKLIPVGEVRFKIRLRRASSGGLLSPSVAIVISLLFWKRRKETISLHDNILQRNVMRHEKTTCKTPVRKLSFSPLELTTITMNTPHPAQE